MWEMVDVELWRQHRLDLVREVEVDRAGWGIGGVVAGLRGWLRRGLLALGYSGPEAKRGVRRGGGVIEGARRVRCRKGARVSRRYCVDSKAAIARFEAAVTGQAALAGGDPAVESAARALRDALGPATRQLALELAEQAAAEVDAQMSHGRVEVVLRGGEPALAVRAGEPAEGRPAGEEYEARITLRLPPSLKAAVEEAARSAGESVNSFLVRDLSRLTARSGRVGKRMRGTLRT